MTKKLFLLSEYLQYLLSAKRGGHGVHSPFVFDFVKHVVEDNRHYYAFDQIETLRKNLYADHQLLQIEDFGAGSHQQNTQQRSVSSIAKTAGRTRTFGEILFKIVNHYQYQSILELGTSVGLGTSYLASANKHARVTTIEGCVDIAARAKQSFDALQLHNIDAHIGNFDDVLEPILQSIGKQDLIFIDGNHREKPTCAYFEQCKPYLHHKSMIIFDDIHWSKGMRNAWNHIKKDSAVTLSIDLFFIGMVMCNPDIKEKQHFTIRY